MAGAIQKMDLAKMRQDKQVLVVGAGLSGAVVARRLAEEKGRSVLVIDKRSHIGGNCFDERVGKVMVHRYGAHIFHTKDEQVWKWVSQFTDWHEYEHHVLAWVEDKLIPLPFNLNSIERCFTPEQAEAIKKAMMTHFQPGEKVTILQLRQARNKELRRLADYVYEHVFLHYTLKQWDCRLEDLDACVAERVPVVFSRDDRYFGDQYQGIPAAGYTALIAKILNHPLIKVQLGTNFRQLRDLGWEETYYTGAIDEFFDYRLGELPYRSLKLVTKKYQRENFQETSVVNYPETQHYTRIIEHKYFLADPTPPTVVTYEYPQAFRRGQNERYYPIQNLANQELYERYLRLAGKLEHVHFLGRLGDYRYYDMDQAIKRALEIAL